MDKLVQWPVDEPEGNPVDKPEGKLLHNWMDNIVDFLEAKPVDEPEAKVVDVTM